MVVFSPILILGDDVETTSGTPKSAVEPESDVGITAG